MNTFETFKQWVESVGATIEYKPEDYENTGEVFCRVTTEDGFVFSVTVNQ